MSNNKTTTDNKSDKAVKKEGDALITLGWLAMLFVVGSIAFSSYMVFFGTDSTVARAMLAPQVLFAASVMIYKFVKR